MSARRDPATGTHARTWQRVHRLHQHAQQRERLTLGDRRAYWHAYATRAAAVAPYCQGKPDTVARLCTLEAAVAVRDLAATLDGVEARALRDLADDLAGIAKAPE